MPEMGNGGVSSPKKPALCLNKSAGSVQGRPEALHPAAEGKPREFSPEELEAVVTVELV